MSVWKTVRKFLHRDDGLLYTTQGVAIPIKATTLGDDPTITGTLTVEDIDLEEQASWIIRQQVFS